MLDNARKYVEELRNKLIDAWYDERYKYYFVGNWHKEYSPSQDDWEEMCFVSLDNNGNILGLISYRLDRNISAAYDFGAINLSDNKSVFGMDLYRVIDNIFCKFNMQRIEFNVVCGNPIEKSYDKMVAKCGGRIIGTRRRAAKLLDNQIYDDKLYEILREDYLNSKKQAKREVLKAYRVENQEEQHGIWRDFDGTVNPVFKHLSQGKCKDMPMEDSDFYRADGLRWFSATDTPEKLKAWFSALDVIEMERLGYKVYEFEISNCKVVSEYEIAFTRESVLSQREIDPNTVWGSEFAQLRKAGESNG